MIRLEHISAGYLPGEDILKDISCTLEPGSFHFLTGPSGAGKSTLLNLLSLKRLPSKGTIHMFGKPVTTLPREELPALRRKIGMVFQDFRLIDHLTVEENVALPVKISGIHRPDTAAHIKELLSWVELEPYHKARPEVLSGGQKQKVAIARAVINKPELLLADEPTGNLDPKLSLKFMHLFKELNKDGTTIVIATHDEHLVSQLKYPVLRLEHGRLIKL